MAYGPNIIIAPGLTEAPKFCHNCGEPYTWTKNALEAVSEYAKEISELDETEKELLIKSLPDLISDSPKQPTAIARFKKVGKKLSAETVGAMKDILVNVVSESVRKSIWG